MVRFIFRKSEAGKAVRDMILEMETLLSEAGEKCLDLTEESELDSIRWMAAKKLEKSFLIG